MGDEKPEEQLAEALDSLDVEEGEGKGGAPAERDQLHDGELVVERSGPEVGTAKDFESLHLDPRILKGVYAMGFNKPSRIQETALPILLQEPPEDMVAQSQSGTGKTAAFVLALLSRVAKAPAGRTAAVVVSPARELARQTHEVAKTMAQFMDDVDVLLAVPDGPQLPKRGTKITPRVVVGTPGKLLDLVKSRCVDVGGVAVLVYDEADQMFEGEGNKDSMATQARRLRSLMKKAQVLLFSATFREEVTKFADGVVREPCAKLRLKQEELTLDALTQMYIAVADEAHKFRVLADVYAYLTVGQSIIFVNRVSTAKRLAEHMREQDHQVSVLYGRGMAPDERDRVIDEYRSGRTRHLITTNVLSRGIDVAQVSLVINVDLPVMMGDGSADVSTYLHRIGRTARYGRPGIAISLVAEGEMPLRDQLVEYFQCKIDRFDEQNLPELEDMLKSLGVYV